MTFMRQGKNMYMYYISNGYNKIDTYFMSHENDLGELIEVRQEVCGKLIQSETYFMDY